jgi:two-component system, NarL family, nitrate/nitrite response regulator NarL
MSRVDPDPAAVARRFADGGLVVVTDVRLYSDGIVAALRERGYVSTIDVVPSVRDLLARGARPSEVVLLDMSLPAAFEAARMLTRRDGSLRIVGLGIAEQAPLVIACAEAGLAGYVPREGSIDDLLAAVDRAFRDEFACPPRVAAALLRRIATLAARQRLTDDETRLTARELEVVDLIAEGCTNKEIAMRLSIELGTVKKHVHNVLEKLGLKRRGEISAWAQRMRPLVSLLNVP